MNTVERLVLRNLREEISKITENTSEKNKDRQDNLRMFTHNASRRAFEIIRALEENDEEEAHKMPDV